jgi:hypothetical protein
VKTLFWVLLGTNLLLGGFLIYHFVTYEHTPVPSEPTLAAYAESLRVYQGRLDELEQSAAQARQKLDRAGKSTWPAVHNRLESVDAEIGHLRTVMEHWRQEPSAVGLRDVYHEALAAYGRAGALYLSVTFDTLPEPRKESR